VDVEDQWLYGPDFLVGPVLVQGATSRSVYLPALINATWVYRWNGTDAGSGGHRVTVDTTSLSDFPLFVRTPA
jgi:alpha-glucosidase (family GH31 glycosyl hydrolase)